MLDVRLLLLIGQKRKLVKPVNRAKRRDFISNLQGKTELFSGLQLDEQLESQVKQS